MDHGIVMKRSQDAIDLAVSLASQAHATQARKYTGAPYITHPIDVAKRVIDAGWDDRPTVLAALFHDTVEDTEMDFQQLLSYDAFPPHDGWVELVWWLTDDKREPSNRATRKKMQRWRLARAPQRAKIVKLADVLSNGQGEDGIIENDPDFAPVFMREVSQLVEVLAPPPLGNMDLPINAAHWELFDQAGLMISEYEEGR